AAVDDDRTGRYKGVTTERGSSDNTAAPIHHYTGRKRGIVVVEIRTHGAIVVANKKIGIGSATEHGSDRVLDRKYLWQLHLVVRIQRMQGLVKSIGLVRDWVAWLL